MRDEDEAHEISPGQLAFGEKVRHGRAVENKAEVERISKMVELRKAGFSYHKIADALNAMGVPTKSRKAKWHATTVMKILDRN